MATPQIKRIDDGLTLASIDEIALAYVPAKTPTIGLIGSMRSHLIATALESPKGIGFLMLIPEQAGAPDGAARDEAREMFRSLSGRLKIMVGVLEGAGFAASAKRSVFTILVGVGSGAGTTKVVATIEAGSEWMAEQSKRVALRCPTASALQALVEEMRHPKK